MVRDYAAKVLELLVLIFDGALEPVLAVEIHYDTTLIEAVMALPEGCLHNKAEELILRLHLQYRRVIIAEMVIRPLPEISVRRSRYRNPVTGDLKGSRFSCPFELIQIHCPGLLVQLQ